MSAAGIRAKASEPRHLTKASERWRSARGPACCAMRGGEVERGKVELHQVSKNIILSANVLTLHVKTNNSI